MIFIFKKNKTWVLNSAKNIGALRLKALKRIERWYNNGIYNTKSKYILVQSFEKICEYLRCQFSP